MFFNKAFYCKQKERYKLSINNGERKKIIRTISSVSISKKKKKRKKDRTVNKEVVHINIYEYTKKNSLYIENFQL